MIDATRNLGVPAVATAGDVLRSQLERKMTFGCVSSGPWTSPAHCTVAVEKERWGRCAVFTHSCWRCRWFLVLVTGPVAATEKLDVQIDTIDIPGPPVSQGTFAVSAQGAALPCPAGTWAPVKRDSGTGTTACAQIAHYLEWCCAPPSERTGNSECLRPCAVASSLHSRLGPGDLHGERRFAHLDVGSLGPHLPL